MKDVGVKTSKKKPQRLAKGGPKAGVKTSKKPAKYI
jgi:hypothetical protein